MQIKEKQKDKRNSGSFIKNPANNENNNVSNGRQRTNGMAEAEAEVIINELQDGKIVDNERIITLLDIFLNDKKISPMTIASLKNEYINILQDIYMKNDSGLNKDISFSDKLIYMGIDRRMYSIVLKQINNFRRFINDKFKTIENGDMLSDEDMKLLLKILLKSPREMNDLYKNYQNILKEKDIDEAIEFITRLRTQGVSNKICDIVLLQFCNSGIILPAEVRPSVLGNLVVPENAKFVKRAENKENFLGELHPVGKDEGTTLHGVLHNYFDELVIQPIKDASNILSEYKFKNEDFSDKDFEIAFKEAFKEKISQRTIENLKKWLDKKLNDRTIKLLNYILKKDIKALADIAEKLNNQTRMMTPDEFAHKNNTKEIKDKIRQIRSKLPCNEDLINFMKCVILSDMIKNRENSSLKSKKDWGEEYSYRTPFYSLILKSLKGEKLTNEEIVYYKKDMLFNSLNKATNPLFYHKPCAADINQGGLGDCYFLSALISLVNSPEYGPNFIMDMMKDNMDGTVTVRLYRPSSDPAASEIDESNITSLHEIFVKVYKHGIIYSPNCALWVNILEQAYAVIGGNLLKYKVRNDNYYDKKNEKRKIADISAGHSSFSFMTLTGKIAYIYNEKIAKNKYNMRCIYDYAKDKLGLISNALNRGLPVTTGFYGSFNTKEGKRIVDGHAYSVLKVEEKNGKQYVVLINPNHGGETISCSIEEIEKNLRAIHICVEDLNENDTERAKSDALIKELKEGKIVDSSRLINLLDTFLKKRGVDRQEIDSLEKEYLNILMENDKEQLIMFGKRLTCLRLDKIYTILLNQFVNASHFIDDKIKISNKGNMLSDEDMQALFTMLPDGLKLYNDYKQTLAKQKGTGEFIKNLMDRFKVGDKFRLILSKQRINYGSFVTKKTETLKNGEMLPDEDMQTLFKILPDGLNLYEEFKDILAKVGDPKKFINGLKQKGLSENICNLLIKQSEHMQKIAKAKKEAIELLDELELGKIVDNSRLINLLDTFLEKRGVDRQEIDSLEKEYLNILMKNHEENVKDFNNKLTYLGLGEMYSIVLKQFINVSHFIDDKIKILNKGNMIPYEDMQTLFKMLPDGLKLYNDYKQTLAKQKGTGEFIKNLMDRFKVGDEFRLILSKQRINYGSFITKKTETLKNGEMLSDEDMKLSLGILSKSPEEMNHLYENYQNILSEKDIAQAGKFITELQTKGASNKICDILLLQFRNSGIILPAEVRPSVLGNLVVPENAKFVKRAENKENFLGELHPVGKDEKTTLHGVLHNYFDEFVIKPITDANNILSEYIKKGFEIKDFPGIDGFSIRNAFKKAFKEEISKGTIENLKKWLDEKLDDGTVKSLNDILKNDIKALGYIAEKLNNQTKIMAPDEFEQKNNTIDKTLEEIKDKIKQIRSKLPSNEDFINFMKCVVLSDTIKNGADSRIDRFIEIFGEENSYRTPFYSLIMEDHNGKKFTPEERVEYKKDMLFNSLTKATNPLFSHKPCAADINQDGLGDCYFLAALISLVNSPQYGPNFIMNMMKDNMDGTVTVRLYRASSDSAVLEIDKKGNITSLHEIFVKVYKHGITYSPDCALWVNILEQAYAVIGGNLLKNKVDDKEKNDYNYYRNRKRKIADISAGRSNFSFMTLTGQVAYLYNKKKKINDTENYRDIYAYTNKYGGLFKFISNALNKGFPVTIAFDDDFNTKEGKRIVDGHAYSVLKTVQEYGRQYIVLINPHHGGETICCPIEKIEKCTKGIDVCGEDL